MWTFVFPACVTGMLCCVSLLLLLLSLTRNPQLGTSQD